MNAPDVIAAWDEYLEACRLADPDRYAEVERWAWHRLERRLTAVGDRAKAAAAAEK